jgi:HD-GYP domain-containing protein (c-di-GMP phosphodiesterase class II)
MLMNRYLPFVAGAAAGVWYVREHRTRRPLERLGAAALEALLAAIDANNPETGEHARRVADYALERANAGHMDEKTRRSIERVALFHDIGKIDGALSDIVAETTRLTPREREAIMTHPETGAEVLRPLAGFYPDLPEGVLSHHERWDGKGYPRKLREEMIPLASRVVAIADTFDAMTHSRSYSRARSIDEATRVIAEGRGRQFDPALVDLFLSLPVRDYVERSVRVADAPRRAPGKRHGGKAADEIPDITFRWRRTAPSQQRKGR